MKTFRKITIIFFVEIMLSGCTPEVSESVVEYVDMVKNRKSVYKGDLPSFPKGSALKYTASKLRDPFIPYFLGGGSGGGGGGSSSSGSRGVNSGIKRPAGGPDLNRKREALESYPLDSLAMVGTIEQNGVYQALLRDSSGRIHRVKAGNYVGQNAGKIERITAGEIKIKQWLSDNKGGWREFPVTIYLTEAKREIRGAEEAQGGR